MDDHADGDSDLVLVQRAGQGDAGACGVLVGRHLPRILHFASRMLGDTAAAEDVAQEVFLRLWTNAATWRPGAAQLSTWLHRIALNLCLDRRRRYREEPLPEAMEPMDDTPDAIDLLQRRDTKQRVAAALATLPEAQRTAVVLCHYQELRNIEAAEVMGVSIEALESLLARGRRSLRERLRAALPELLESSR